jgi:hypothetical protein
VSDDPRPERIEWAISHEVGESQSYRVFAGLGVDPLETPPAARETVANRLAGCILLPRDWFLVAGRAVEWDLCDLKLQFSTASHELIARRMLEMPPPVIVTLFDQRRPQWRRSNRLFRSPPLAPAEEETWLAAHSTGLPARRDVQELQDELLDVRAWPIHEPPWFREIVRTALVDQ